eukprot:SAG25_NODE_265_length_10686_cov_15.394163_6_plen_55_part_00
MTNLGTMAIQSSKESIARSTIHNCTAAALPYYLYYLMCTSIYIATTVQLYSSYY